MKIESAKKYFEKNGYIYGVSTKNGLIDCFSTYIEKFNSWEEAMEWLETEEYDFRERCFVSKTRAEKIKREL